MDYFPYYTMEGGKKSIESPYFFWKKLYAHFAASKRPEKEGILYAFHIFSLCGWAKTAAADA